MHVSPQADADFYTSVYTMRRESRLWSERGRGAERHSFACRQWIALYDDGDAEHERTFREVACQDISTGGFSFLLHEIPAADQLCIRLGAPGSYVYLTGQMVHCSPIDTDGGPGFLIGCRFTGRSDNVRELVLEATSA